MSDNGTEFNTPVGRIVWGHPLKPQKKTDDNNQPVLRDGVQVMQWSFGVAIDKASFQAQVWPFLAAEAAKGYPQGAPPSFSYKYADGDDSNPVWNKGKQGKPRNQRPGHAGHFILTINTELQAPNVVRFDNGVYREVLPDQIKTGDYVAMTLIAKWHAGQSPGLYLNPGVIVHAFEGDAISNGGLDIDPTQAFGATPQFAMPAGARPLGAPAPVGGGMPPMAPPAAAPQPVMPGAAPAPVQYAPPMAAPQPIPAAPLPAPAHDFVQNAGVPVMPGAAPVAPQYAPAPVPGAFPMPGAPAPR